MMMFGFGWLMMLLVIGVPILLVVLLLVGAADIFQNRAHSLPVAQYQAPVTQSTLNANQLSSYSRYCAHCGAGLKSDWTHCPQCGATVQ